MTLSSEELSIIKQEEALLEQTIASLKEQLSNTDRKFANQSKLARELTAEIVNSTRDEDKAQVASDEAVAHGLSKKSLGDRETIIKQIEEPYFARVELIEDTAKGDKPIEYKLGKNSNTDCRIIDWRKAPIAKLYYEYNEGDFYSEDILGKERNGEVKLKYSYEIKKGQLKKLICSKGTFIKTDGTWQKSDEGVGARDSYDALPDILSLITEEQYQSITQDVDSPVLIQGIAGSGKTVVALHRLSWLLHPDNSDFKESEIAIVVKNPSLKKYIENSLEKMEHSGVKTYLYQEYLEKLVQTIAPEVIASGKLQTPYDEPPLTARTLYNSQGFRKLTYQIVQNNSAKTLPEILRVIGNTHALAEQLIKLDTSNLINNKIISAAENRFKNLEKENYYDLSIWTIALNIFCKLNPEKCRKLYKHLIVDEIQDFSEEQVELLFKTCNSKRSTTLVGDQNQTISLNPFFSGWDFIKEQLDLEAHEKLIQLSVSHRSTLAIMKLADFILGEELTQSGREGRIPLWLECKNEDTAIEASKHWLKTAQEKYPHAPVAVVCKNKHKARTLYSYLEPYFGSSVSLGVENFSFAAGIIVCDIASIKGLEFFNVLIWDVSARTYPANTLSKKELYVAATRAEENLCFVSHLKPTDFLKNASKNLVRRHIFELDE